MELSIWMPSALRSLALALALTTPAALAAAPYREYEPMETYLPHVRGDLMLSGSYRYWSNPKSLDWRLAGNPDENWKLNWKFMDPPFNNTVHGGHFALDRGEELFARLNGQGRLARCLGARPGAAGLRALRAQYPMYRPELQRVMGLEAMIERCAAQQDMTLQNGSYDNSAVSLYLASLGLGVPLAVDVSRGPMKQSFERGRKLFHMRTGRSNVACASCHTHRVGLQLRSTTVTTPYGDAAHYPVYRTRFQLQSLHLRFMECNLDSGTQPLRPGSRAYTDLEVFMTALSNGYPVSVPSERN